MILDKGQIEKTAQFGINDHAALVEKLEASEKFQEELDARQVANLAAYFVTVPSEIAMKLWTVMGEGNVKNTVALHQSVTIDGVAVSSFLVELLTGQ